jgi:hypothetical protein
MPHVIDRASTWRRAGENAGRAGWLLALATFIAGCCGPQAERTASRADHARHLELVHHYGHGGPARSHHGPSSGDDCPVECGNDCHELASCDGTLPVPGPSPSPRSRGCEPDDLHPLCVGHDVFHPPKTT